jgi:integrase
MISSRLLLSPQDIGEIEHGISAPRFKNVGVDIYALSRLLGHSELRTTEIYADILESRRRDAMLDFPNVLG